MDMNTSQQYAGLVEGRRGGEVTGAFLELTATAQTRSLVLLVISNAVALT
jgi:hypothetical protein